MHPNQRGRKRKSCKREGGGRVLRDSAEIGRQKSAEFFGNQPDRRNASDPLDERLGYPLGRLFIQGELSRQQWLAGQEWAQIVMEYSRLLGLPAPTPKATHGALMAIGGLSIHEPEQAAIDRARREYDAAYCALVGANRGLGVARVCRDVCVLDRHEDTLSEGQLDLLRRGLDALTKLFRIPAAENRRIHPFGVSVAV